MAEYEICAVFKSTDIITIHADSENEAMQLFNEGEFDGEHNSDYALDEVKSITKIEDQ